MNANTPTAGSILSRWRDAMALRLSRHPFSPPSPVKVPVDSAELTLEALRQVDEGQFEQLVTAFFGTAGFRTESKGAETSLFAREATSPFGLVLRKCRTLEVGDTSVAELQGSLAARHLTEGYIVTTGTFTAAARARDTGRKIMLLDGREFVLRLNRLPRPMRVSLLAILTAPDLARPAA